MPAPLEPLALTPTKDGVRLEVHAKPRAKRSAVVGVRESALEVAIAAPPVDGAANEELVAFVSATLKVPKRDVVLVRGEGSRTKLLEIRGLDADTVRARLGAALA